MLEFNASAMPIVFLKGHRIAAIGLSADRVIFATVRKSFFAS